MYRDDEDEGLARPEDQYRSDKKEVRRKRAAESKGNLLKLQRDVLRGKVGKDKAPKKDENPSATLRAGDEKDAKPPETFGTKTHAQEEQKQVQKADEKQTDEQMMERQQRQEEAKRQAGEEYQANAG